MSERTKYFIALSVAMTFMFVAGCGITGTAKKDEPQVTKAEFVQMKQLVIEQNEMLEETTVYLKQIANNTGRIANALEKEDISTKELLDSMSRF